MSVCQALMLEPSFTLECQDMDKITTNDKHPVTNGVMESSICVVVVKPSFSQKMTAIVVKNPLIFYIRTGTMFNLSIPGHIARSADCSLLKVGRFVLQKCIGLMEHNAGKILQINSSFHLFLPNSIISGNGTNA